MLLWYGNQNDTWWVIHTQDHPLIDYEKCLQKHIQIENVSENTFKKK